MRKKELLLGMLAMATISLCACGSGAESAEKNTTTKVVEEQNGSTTKTDESTKDTTTGEIKSNITTAKEKEVVIYIGDVAVKFDQTWEEFQHFMTEVGWTFSKLNPTDTYPNNDCYNASFFVDTKIGQVELSFMENEDKTGSVIRDITVYRTYVKSNDINICGVNPLTTHEEVASVLDVEQEFSEGVTYKLDDWLYVSIWNTDEETGKSNIQIERKMFHMRETE